ncbi:hypothetical protein EV121DRAFT_291497 [Schizophyllum commune]
MSSPPSSVTSGSMMALSPPYTPPSKMLSLPNSNSVISPPRKNGFSPPRNRSFSPPFTSPLMGPISPPRGGSDIFSPTRGSDIFSAPRNANIISPPRASMGTTLHHHEKRHDDLWRADGNLVLKAGGTVYRLHASFLEKYSPVLARILSLPPLELFDDWPVVRLDDDELSFTVFLRALMHPETYPPPPATPSRATSMAILRLATKYEIRHLRTRALHHLNVFFPTTPLFKGWRDLGNRAATFPDILAYARECNAPFLAPACAYNLVCAMRDAGELSTATASLPAEDRARYLRLWAELAAAHHRLTACVFDLPSESQSSRRARCVGGAACIAWRAQYVGVMALVPPARLLVPGFWDMLGQVAPIVTPNAAQGIAGQQPCQPCVKYVHETHEDARKRFWEELPVLLDLGPWTKLVMMRLEAIAPPAKEIPFEYPW